MNNRLFVTLDFYYPTTKCEYPAAILFSMENRDRYLMMAKFVRKRLIKGFDMVTEYTIKTVKLTNEIKDMLLKNYAKQESFFNVGFTAIDERYLPTTDEPEFVYQYDADAIDECRQIVMKTFGENIPENLRFALEDPYRHNYWARITDNPLGTDIWHMAFAICAKVGNVYCPISRKGLFSTSTIDAHKLSQNEIDEVGLALNNRYPFFGGEITRICIKDTRFFEDLEELEEALDEVKKSEMYKDYEIYPFIVKRTEALFETRLKVVGFKELEYKQAEERE